MASVGGKILFNAQAMTGAAVIESTVVSMNINENDFIGFLNITAAGGTTVVTAKIQHSPDNTNWFDLVTFTVPSAGATGAQAIGVPLATFCMNFIKGTVTLTGATKTATVSMQLLHSKP